MSSIYIHIPYCSQKCSYCNFYFILGSHKKNELIDALCKEIYLQKTYLKSKTIKTLYFGGGTPSILNQKELLQIFNTIHKHYNISKECEITFECNPEDLDIDKLKSLYNIGVNRLSIGIQSFNDNELKFMNRKHDAARASAAVSLAKKVGFNNISIDLIFSLPNQTIENWKQNIDIAIGLDAQHISTYSLTVEEKTKIYNEIKKGNINELDGASSADQYNLLIEKCNKAGFVHYEISNFGKKGFFSKHNSNYWKGNEYLGIGPSAHSYNKNSRQWNISSVNKYIKNINKGVIPFEKEILDIQKKYNEYIITSIRTIWGVDLSLVQKKFGDDYYSNITRSHKKWLKSKDIIKSKNKILLTKKGKFISDTIASDLIIT